MSGTTPFKKVYAENKKIILSAQSSGPLVMLDLENLNHIKLLDSALLIVDNTTQEYVSEKKIICYLYKSNSIIYLDKLHSLFVSSKLYFLLLSDDVKEDIKLRYREYVIATNLTLENINIPNDKYLFSFFYKLKIVAHLQHGLQQALLKLSYTELLIYLIEKYGKEVLEIVLTNLDFNKTEFTLLMENKIMKNLTLEELAFVSNMSVSKFKRIFAEVYGNTPMQWFKEQRINEAAKILLLTSKTIKQISELVGYQNPSNFIRVFKKYYGVSPNDYRKQKYSF